MRQGRTLLVTALASLLLLAGSTATARTQVPMDSIDAHLDALAEDRRIPGLAVRILHDDDIVHERLAGTDGNGEPVAADTPFLVGSIAKSVTATLVLRLIESGDLSLDDRAGDLVEELDNPTPTLRTLLTHTSGYSTVDGLRIADRADNEAGALDRAVGDLRATGEPGAYAYSAANYLVLGAVVEHVTGEPFGLYAERQLMDPLGMGDSAATAQRAGDIPPGHRYWWGRPRAFDAGFDDSGAPFGYMVTTLDDLTRYALAQDSDALLRPELRRQAQSEQVETSSGGYGFGWRITDHGGEKVVHHTGANAGYFAHVLRVPEDGLTVVLMANAHSEARAPTVTGAAFDLVTLLDGGSPEEPDPDPLLSAMPWLLTGIAVLITLAAAATFTRPRRRGHRLIAAAGMAGLAVALWSLPTLIGYDHRLLRLWFPDAATACVAAAIMAVIAAALLATPARTPSAGRRGQRREMATE